MPTTNLKQVAHELIDKLPDDASWDDVVYEMVTRREIEAGLADSEANRSTLVEESPKNSASRHEGPLDRLRQGAP
jgi:hypothetical protein